MGRAKKKRSKKAPSLPTHRMRTRSCPGGTCSPPTTSIPEIAPDGNSVPITLTPPLSMSPSSQEEGVAVAVQGPSSQRAEEQDEVEFRNGCYNAQHERDILAGVSAARLWASQVETSTSYYDTYGPAKQTLDSFNHFMKVDLPLILMTNGYFQHDDVIDARQGRMRTHKVSITQVRVVGEGSKIQRQEADGEKYVCHPHDARTRGLTYSRRLEGKFRHQILEVDSAGGTTLIATGTDVITIGEIPVMVKSNLCSLAGYTDEQLIAAREDPDDPGGYFIIKGKEKVLISQERPAHNQIFIFQPMAKAGYELEAEVRSVAHEAAETVSALWIRIPGIASSAESRSNLDVDGQFRARGEVHGDKFQHFSYIQGRHIVPAGSGYIHEHKAQIEEAFLKQNPGLEVHHVSLQHPLPLLTLYKALGYLDDALFWETLGLSNSEDQAFLEAIKPTIEDCGASEITTQRDALIFIGQMTKQRASEQYLDRETGSRRVFTDDDYYVKGLTFVNAEVLPHIGNGEESVHNDRKAYHIGYIVNRLIQTKLGRLPCDDRDHLQNKRFDLPGPLMANLTKKLVAVVMEEMRKGLCRKVDKNHKYDFFKQIGGSSTLTQGFTYAFSTGNWGPKAQSSSTRVGVSQALNRLTPIATVSFLRRVNAPLNRLSRMSVPRRVHNTGFGYICPVDTPEGEPVGFLKNFSIMAQVSVEANVTPVLKSLQGFGMNPLTPENAHRLSKETKIFINATLVGTCPSGPTSIDLVEMLKTHRRAWDPEKYVAFQSTLAVLRQGKLTQNERLGLDGSQLGDCDETDLVSNLEYVDMISNQISIAHDYSRQEIRIRTDGGRPLRPLYVVKQNKLQITEEHVKGLVPGKENSPSKITWNDLIKAGVVELLDPAEEETALIAMYPINLVHSRKPIYLNGVLYQDYRSVSYTHCEIDPGGILSVSAALIPFANHNQAHRMSFQTNIAKQAVGVYALNYATRFDTDSHILMYGGQKPLVTCKAAASFSKYDSNPAGQNAIVAIACYTGYNQEDSLIFNSSSIQRGLFRSINFKVKEDSARINKAFGDQNEMLERPNSVETGTARGEFNQILDTDGLPYVGSEIRDGHLLIGKTQLTARRVLEENAAQNRKSFIKLDMSQVYRAPCYSAGSYCDSDKVGRKAPINPSRSLVDHVSVFDNEEGYRSTKVRLRQVRCPQIGDKFSSRHGQKGVMGMSIDEVDMPFTKDGIVPDIIMNPHAIPSRMTIGHMLEMLYGKIAAFTKVLDRPPFHGKEDSNDGKEVEAVLANILTQRGFNSQGYETMYCGHTGRKISAQVFIGPCFYQRLKHMTEDKLRFRARGPLTTLGRQPICGQTREGGLRFGEMERDSAIAHGGMQFVRERLFLLSDYYTLTICQHCGQGLTRFSSILANNTKNYFYKCGFCKSNRGRGNLIEIPYATKLLFQELMCMHVNVRIITELVDQGNSIVAQKVPQKSTGGWYTPTPYNPSCTSFSSVVDKMMSGQEEYSFEDVNDARQFMVKNTFHGRRVNVSEVMWYAQNIFHAKA